MKVMGKSFSVGYDQDYYVVPGLLYDGPVVFGALAIKSKEEQ